MNMFQSFLASIPSNRSEMVNELEIPDIPLTPYIWEPDPVSLSDSSLETVSVAELAEDARSLSTDSSIVLSRAMTGSEFDYDWYSRYKRLDLSDPWEQMRIGWAKFPPEQIATLNSLQSTATDSVETASDSIPFEPFPSQEFLRKIDRFLEEECCVFGPDDPALLELEEALRSVDLEIHRFLEKLRVKLEEALKSVDTKEAILPDELSTLHKICIHTQTLYCNYTFHEAQYV